MSLEEKNLEVQNCSKCVGYSQGKAFFRGDIKAKILIVGEAAGKTEVKYSQPFMGVCGKTLQRWIGEHNFKVAITNVCMCKPFYKPTKEMELNCRPYLEWVVNTVKPKVIFPFGTTAFKAVLGIDPLPSKYVSEQCYTISRVNSFGIDVLTYPMPHPRYFISTGKGVEGKKIPKLSPEILKIIEGIK